MVEPIFDYQFRLILIGDSTVGKSSLLKFFTDGKFAELSDPTVGVDFFARLMEMKDGTQIKLQLWDTAGQEEFDAITKAYYRGAQACVLTFSTTDRASFDAIKDWKRKVENECNEIPTVIVQNKIDLIEQSVVTADEVETLARNLNCRLIRTSVKEDVNVASVFRYLATKCHQLMLGESCDQSYTHAGGNGGGSSFNGSSSGHQPTISAFSPTFTKSNSGTIVLRAAKKSSTARKRKIVLKKCGIL
uniref:Ras-related protein Rab-23 n=1 Tax=Ceratitis capitata TaxID=7213 RepID=W8AB61_CERCA